MLQVIKNKNCQLCLGKIQVLFFRIHDFASLKKKKEKKNRLEPSPLSLLGPFSHEMSLFMINNLNILGVEVVSLFLVGCLLGSFPKLGIKTETYRKGENGLSFRRKETYQWFGGGGGGFSKTGTLNITKSQALVLQKSLKENGTE